MYSTLYKYLALHKKLNIPGIGNFVITESPATLQFTDKQLHAPATQVQFTQVVHPTNNHFYSFLSKEWKVEKVIAIRMYKDGVEELLDNLKASGMCELPGIGILQKTADGSVNFTPAATSLSLFSNLPAERVLRRNAQHTVLVGEREHIKINTSSFETVAEDVTDEKKPAKDNWLIYALVLAVLAILMIAYYYIAYKTN